MNKYIDSLPDIGDFPIIEDIPEEEEGLREAADAFFDAWSKADIVFEPFPENSGEV